MVSPKEAFSTIENAIRQDGTYLTEVEDVVLKRLDLDKEQTTMSQPFVAIYPLDLIRSSPHDTERVGYVTSNGDRVGRKFKATFEVPLQIDIHAARENDSLDMDDLGWELLKLLRPYDHRNEDLPLPDENGDPQPEIHHFAAGDGERNDDLAMAPSLARWSHEAMMEFHDIVETTDPTIKVVHTPRLDTMTGDGVMIEYEY